LLRLFISKKAFLTRRAMMENANVAEKHGHLQSTTLSRGFHGQQNEAELPGKCFTHEVR